FPADGTIPVSGTAAGLVEYAVQYAANLHWKLRFMVWLMFLFIPLSPFLLGPVPCRFTSLKPTVRHAALQRMSRSSRNVVRATSRGWGAGVSMPYAASPAAARPRAARRQPAAHSGDARNVALSPAEAPATGPRAQPESPVSNRPSPP